MAMTLQCELMTLHDSLYQLISFRNISSSNSHNSRSTSRSMFAEAVALASRLQLVLAATPDCAC